MEGLYVTMPPEVSVIFRGLTDLLKSQYQTGAAEIHVCDRNA